MVLTSALLAEPCRPAVCTRSLTASSSGLRATCHGRRSLLSWSQPVTGRIGGWASPARGSLHDLGGHGPRWVGRQPPGSAMSAITRSLNAGKHEIARSALPLRAEIGRQLRRRRTIGIFPCSPSCRWCCSSPSGSAMTAATPANADSSISRRRVVRTWWSSPSSPRPSFLLIVIVALFAGDTVPSEASWSSLRYLLAAPVRRERLLRQKLVVAALSSVVALVFLPAWTLVVGGHRVRLGSLRRPYRKPDRLARLRMSGC